MHLICDSFKLKEITVHSRNYMQKYEKVDLPAYSTIMQELLLVVFF